MPEGLPAGTKPDCWKAVYAGTPAANAAPASAEVWACGYEVSGGAFDAMQRARAAADTVKFQEDRYLVLVKWQGGSRDLVTTLVRALQKRLARKS